MKIVFNYPLSRNAYDFLNEKLPKGISVVAKIRGEAEVDVPINEDPEMVKEMITADIIMGPYVTEEILSKAIPPAGGNLKLLLIPWTGVDRINFNLIKKYPIKVANSHANARTVAEHTIALLLTSSKEIIHHDSLLRKGLWSSRFRDRPSMIIKGKTVGLLGFGAIGTECAKLLFGFDVKFIACKRNPNRLTDEQKKIVEESYSTENLQQFLEKSDIIINSLPLTNETENFLSKKEFNQMKEGSILINIGRGKTINQEALYDSLKEGKLFAVGLDPMWNYARRNEIEKGEAVFPSDYPLQEFDNVVLSPHRAADVQGFYEEHHLDDVIENIIRIYEGKEPINIIDIDKEY